MKYNALARAVLGATLHTLLMGVFVLSVLFATNTPVNATAGINQQMNFQGRLLTGQGAVVADGYYNIQFKIYQDGDGQSANNTTGSPAGTLKWTENWLNQAGKGVMVKNGYMSVQLGSITPFGNSVDWNQDTLWLSINIGNTNTTCTPFTACAGDGEMLPMKRLSATPYALNAGAIGGKTAGQFVQLAQGVQADTSTNTSSIFLNKTGTGGNFLQLQAAGSDVFSVNNTGDVLFGNTSNHTISVATAGTTAGQALTVSGGAAGTGAGALAGGNLVLQGGNGGGTNGNGGNILIDAGTKNGTGQDGTIAIGTAHASGITIGSTALGAGNTQTIALGTNNSSGTTNVTVGSGSGASAGTTTVQAKDTVTIATNGVTRGTFDNAGNLYLGNGVTATSPNNMTISGTSSNATGVAGGSLTVQGGNATTGNANGGNVTLTGGNGIGTGSNGLVVITTPTFSTTTADPACFTGGNPVAASCTIAQTSINNSSAILVGFSADGKTATMPDPTNAMAGRVIYVTASGTSKDFTLSVNGGGQGNQIAMRKNTTATMIWNGSDWTAAGASSSTTLQAAYDNTLQSAGGAELVVSKTSATNGFTIRDSSVNSVNGTLFSVQTASAAGLFQVNSNVTEYASDAGAEVGGAAGGLSDNTFPASTWAAAGGASLSRYTTAGDYIATGQGSVQINSVAASDGAKNTLTKALTANMHYNVSFSTRLTKGTAGTFTNMSVSYSADGTTGILTNCTSNQTTATSIWTKVNCTFTAPASGITAANAIYIQQATAATRTFYVDNLSVTIAADYNLAADGGVDDNTNFATNWSAAGGATVTRAAIGNDASDSAQVTTAATAGQGVRNKLSMNPLSSTLYRITAYAASSNAFNDFTVQYSRDGGTTMTACADYNTQTISTNTTAFTMVTCYVTTDATAATNPYVYFTQGSGSARTFYVDTFSMVLSTTTTPNVQIGGGTNGGPTTLLTLDRAASAPIAANNNALLGSMYYDTSLGKLQCYEADGWGACGSSPDTIVTLAPEFTNAVLHGTGIGTMTSDICSNSLGINDGSNSQSTICGSGETYNFYKWTSPQNTAQTYSLYVTYQLPANFKSFNSGQTSLMGRTDNGTSGGTGTVQYTVFKNAGAGNGGLTPCDPTASASNGTPIQVATGTSTSWTTKTATGKSDPSTCNFAAGQSIVFKIDVITNKNATAYVGNLNFAFSNR